MNKLTRVLTWFYHVYQTSKDIRRDTLGVGGHIKQWGVGHIKVGGTH